MRLGKKTLNQLGACERHANRYYRIFGERQRKITAELLCDCLSAGLDVGWLEGDMSYGTRTSFFASMERAGLANEYLRENTGEYATFLAEFLQECMIANDLICLKRSPNA